MALSKAVPTPFGVDATYHHVSTVQTHYRDGVCDVVVACFLDEAARRAGHQPLGVLPPARLPLAGLGDGPEPTRPAIYAALLSMPEWEGAVSA